MKEVKKIDVDSALCFSPTDREMIFRGIEEKFGSATDMMVSLKKKFLADKEKGFGGGGDGTSRAGMAFLVFEPPSPEDQLKISNLLDEFAASHGLDKNESYDEEKEMEMMKLAKAYLLEKGIEKSTMEAFFNVPQFYLPEDQPSPNDKIRKLLDAFRKATLPSEEEILMAVNTLGMSREEFTYISPESAKELNNMARAHLLEKGVPQREVDAFFELGPYF